MRLELDYTFPPHEARGRACPQSGKVPPDTFRALSTPWPKEDRR